MKRNVDLKEISDGRLYSSNDMVKADCGNCEGCFACCCGMGQSIVLDPMDIHRITGGLNYTFDTLLAKYIELNVVDGMILPNLKMQDDTARCAFLNEEGRCSIHPIRPGICRLFPLGRYYENGSFQYFLQTHECRKENRAKIKVKKWMDTPNLKKYEEYIIKWHYFLKDMEAYLEEHPEEEKTIGMSLLKIFYMQPYGEDFYAEFDRRLSEVKKLMY